MDNQQVLVRTGCRMFIWTQVYITMYQIDNIVLLDIRTRIVVYIFIHSKNYVVNFDVSSTKDNAYAKLSRYV